MSCDFCKIVSGETYANIIGENDGCLAFVPKDIEVDGHFLVIPKNHFDLIENVPDINLGDLMSFTKQLCNRFKIKYEFDGYNILSASGIAAQQSVNHFHLHILPRKNKDKINAWPDLPGGNNVY